MRESEFAYNPSEDEEQKPIPIEQINQSILVDTLLNQFSWENTDGEESDFQIIQLPDVTALFGYSKDPASVDEQLATAKLAFFVEALADADVLYRIDPQPMSEDTTELELQKYIVKRTGLLGMQKAFRSMNERDSTE